MIDHIYLPVTDLKRSDTFYGGMRLRPSADNLFLYKSAKLLGVRKGPSRATLAKTSLAQAPKSKELLQNAPEISRIEQRISNCLTSICVRSRRVAERVFHR
jgi:hypothetical protein